jgi:hypothetical protein
MGLFLRWWWSRLYAGRLSPEALGQCAGGFSFTTQDIFGRRGNYSANLRISPLAPSDWDWATPFIANRQEVLDDSILVGL